MSDEKVATNPLEETFAPIPVENFETEVENAKQPPLDEGVYLFEVAEMVVKFSQKAREDGGHNRYAQFKVAVIEDGNSENNGRKTIVRKMLEGPGFSFFLDFATACGNTWGRRKEMDMDYLKSFVGCKFKAMAIHTYETEKDNKTFKLNDEGQKILTPFVELSGECVAK